ncbi:MAG: FAD-dependent monooxygenase [Saprospiraceae bacterium]|nr:FAD-dependent monooxygenase [Saprospiraceae bacterium]
MSNKIIIVGAGLCGTLLALRLAQKGYQVVMYERRSDMRKSNVGAGRSINLALSDRGLKGLALVGIEDKILPLVIPMHGRMIHPLNTNTSFVNYSGRKGEWINSVSRGGLNKVLLESAEATGKVTIHFDTECEDVDLVKGHISLTNVKTGNKTNDYGDVIFGTDGAGSAIRNAILNQSAKYRFDFSQIYLSTAYKELEIPAASDGGYRLEKNALHIWPRNGFMMIALPNLDASFTVTLFLPFKGETSFEMLNTDEEIMAFFENNFPTAYTQMPHLLEDFRSNPTSALGTVKCYPWQINDKFLLMGDAAHAVVPFYGQGMNASFEDVVVLDELIDKYEGNWPQILSIFQQIRKSDADAIADLAVENEIEMRSSTADPVFLLKRKMELHLEQKYPDYFSKYSMVTFREDLSYSFAMERGRAQDRILMEYASEIMDFSLFDEYEALKRINNLT